MTSREGGGQAKISELHEIGRTGRSVFTAELIQPEDNPDTALDDFLAVLAYAGIFDGFENKKSL
jgi:hypothetical protein